MTARHQYLERNYIGHFLSITHELQCKYCTVRKSEICYKEKGDDFLLGATQQQVHDAVGEGGGCWW